MTREQKFPYRKMSKNAGDGKDVRIQAIVY